MSSKRFTHYYPRAPAHLYAPTPTQLLNGAYNPDTRYKVPWVINVQKLFLCIARFSFTAE